MPKGKDIWIDEEEQVRQRRIIFWSIAAFVVVFVSVILLRLWLSNTGRNVWLCKDGEWVQVGHPTGQPPGQTCGTGAERYWKDPEEEEEDEIPEQAQFFTEGGNLIKGLPKFDPGKLYFAFDRLGIGTDTLELVFIEDSICTAGERIISCQDPLLQHGVKVKVRGEKYLDKLWVVTLDLEQKNGM
jgi:hypothetical protein